MFQKRTNQIKSRFKKTSDSNYFPLLDSSFDQGVKLIGLPARTLPARGGFLGWSDEVRQFRFSRRKIKPVIVQLIIFLLDSWITFQDFPYRLF